MASGRMISREIFQSQDWLSLNRPARFGWLMLILCSDDEGYAPGSWTVLARIMSGAVDVFRPHDARAMVESWSSRGMVTVESRSERGATVNYLKITNFQKWQRILNPQSSTRKERKGKEEKGKERNNNNAERSSASSENVVVVKITKPIEEPEVAGADQPQPQAVTDAWTGDQEAARVVDGLAMRIGIGFPKAAAAWERHRHTPADVADWEAFMAAKGRKLAMHWCQRCKHPSQVEVSGHGTSYTPAEMELIAEGRGHEIRRLSAQSGH